MITPYYEDRNVTLYHGDCREILPQIEASDVVITDPPYSDWVHEHSRGGEKGGGSKPRDLGFEPLDPELRLRVALEIARIVRRWVLVFSDVESRHLWREDLLKPGLEYVRTGAWVKIGSAPQFTGDRPAAGFEEIAIAHPPGRKRWNGGGSAALWSVPIVPHATRWHPTEKPLGLMKRLVSDFSEPGELILDPFCGSGSTLRACKDLGRRAIGIEAKEEWCAIAVRRLAQETLALGM